MDYVRYDPRRHRKPKAIKAGWFSMRIYEALIDLSAVYDLQGSLSADYLDADFICREVNLQIEDVGLEFDEEDELHKLVRGALGRLVEIGMLEVDGDNLRIKGWDEFYGSKRGGPRTPGKYKGLSAGTETETQEKIFAPHHTTPQDTTPPNVFTGSQLAVLWNEWAVQYGLSRVTKLGGKRKTLADSRAKEQPESYWQEVLARIAKSPGLLGKNDRGWIATFDWLVDPMSAAKVMEGKYDRWGKPSGPGATVSVSEQEAEDLYGPGAK